jgi:hypothetical protein
MYKSRSTAWFDLIHPKYPIPVVAGLPVWPLFIPDFQAGKPAQPALIEVRDTANSNLIDFPAGETHECHSIFHRQELLSGM